MNKSDVPALAAIALKIWDSDGKDELEKEFTDMTHDKETSSFIKFIDCKTIDFAKGCLRHYYVEGCETSPVAYFEALSVYKKHILFLTQMT